MPEYKIEPLKGHPKRYFSNLPQKKKEEIQQAIETISKSPYNHPYKSGGIKHLKKGDYRCLWESKEIYSLRIVYKVNEEEKTIKVDDIAVHIN